MQRKTLNILRFYGSSIILIDCSKLPKFILRSRNEICCLATVDISALSNFKVCLVCVKFCMDVKDLRMARVNDYEEYICTNSLR